MTKRANIPITILVIGIFLVCALALLSFLVYKASVKASFSGVALIEKMNSQIEDYSVYKDLSRVDTKLSSSGKEIIFYQEKKKTSGVLWWKKEKVAFSAEYKIPR